MCGVQHCAAGGAQDRAAEASQGRPANRRVFVTCSGGAVAGAGAPGRLLARWGDACSPSLPCVCWAHPALDSLTRLAQRMCASPPCTSGKFGSSESVVIIRSKGGRRHVADEIHLIRDYEGQDIFLRSASKHEVLYGPDTKMEYLT